LPTLALRRNLTTEDLPAAETVYVMVAKTPSNGWKEILGQSSHWR